MHEGSVRSVKDNWLIYLKSHVEKIHVGSFLPRKLFAPPAGRSRHNPARGAVHIGARWMI